MSKKIFFRSFGSQFGLKIRGWPSPPDPPPLDPPLLISVGSVAMTCTVHSSCAKFLQDRWGFFVKASPDNT